MKPKSVTQSPRFDPAVDGCYPCRPGSRHAVHQHDEKLPTLPPAGMRRRAPLLHRPRQMARQFGLPHLGENLRGPRRVNKSSFMGMQLKPDFNTAAPRTPISSSLSTFSLPPGYEAAELSEDRPFPTQDFRPRGRSVLDKGAPDSVFSRRSDDPQYDPVAATVPITGHTAGPRAHPVGDRQQHHLPVGRQERRALSAMDQPLDESWRCDSRTAGSVRLRLIRGRQPQLAPHAPRARCGFLVEAVQTRASRRRRQIAASPANAPGNRLRLQGQNLALSSR